MGRPARRTARLPMPCKACTSVPHMGATAQRCREGLAVRHTGLVLLVRLMAMASRGGLAAPHMVVLCMGGSQALWPAPLAVPLVR